MADAYDKLIFELSSPGRVAWSLPEADVPEADAKKLLPVKHLRSDAPDLPEVSEFDVVRHYSRLSRMNYGVDTHFYPLGSCTMKYNPKLHEDMARLAGFAKVHPLAPEASAQGALQLMHELARDLAEIAGMDAVSLQPAAGAQGELAGVLMIRAYHQSRGEKRTKVLVPDSAHGTNPASTAIAGYEVVEVKSLPNGEVDVDALVRTLETDVAAFMITVPNTLGMFEPRIGEITELCHAKGVQVYMDGANLNAILGITRPGDLGFDVCHFNLHKTFTTPHGGGGPGAGPVGVKAHLEPFLEAAALDRQAAGVLGQLRHARARLHLHPHDGARRAPLGLRQRDPERELYYEAPRERLRRRRAGAVHARVCPVRTSAKETGRDGDRYCQTSLGSRLLRAVDVLPADRRGGADDRADRDRGEGDARRLLRRDDPDRARGRDRCRAHPRGTSDHVGPPARPDEGGARAESEVDAPRLA